MFASAAHAQEPAESRIASLLSQMTLEEKLGQLTQGGAQETATGPLVQNGGEEQLRKGLVGSILGITGADATRKLQKVAVEGSRLKIPLLFAYDVIHGFRTIFPIPLAEAAGWDVALAERSARAAAVEATANGLHWNYAPMVDIGRDARWGRVMEGAGEDPYLGAALAVARVRGFRGGKRGDNTIMLATAKHFVAYGAAESGRDYNTVDVSERTLRELFFPPFRAAVEAGVDAVMPAFNEVSGIPMTAHRPLIRDVLREQWGFRGIVVSDYTAIRELMMHGVAATRAEAGRLAAEATVDVDMLSNIYFADLPKLVKSGKVSEDLIDDAVRRVLEAKQRLGLFEDPYRYSDAARAKERTQTAETRALARTVAQKSIVLLKNQGELLPLKKDLKTLAVIGALAEDQRSSLGGWAATGKPEDAITVLAGIREAVSKKTKVVYAKGAAPDSDDEKGFAAAVRAAKRADAVVMVLGETEAMSGEARNRTSLGLPGAQQALLEKINALGKPVVVVLMNGRPLAIPYMDEKVPAILESWFLGHEHGHAVADVLFGDVSPSGKLPMTFPRAVGQVPIYYYQKPTGRPPLETERYTSKYLDMPWTPLYAFGHGLSYTHFDYGTPKLSKTKLDPLDAVEVSVTVRNTGKRESEEVVQLYLRDDVASVTRPVRLLRGFQRIKLAAGESRDVKFTLDAADYALLDSDSRRVVEAGTFTVYVGGSSNANQKVQFTVTRTAKLKGDGTAIPRGMRGKKTR